jgi:3-hydroxyacyl-[acyl-carrier-protein] dehydratase
MQNYPNTPQQIISLIPQKPPFVLVDKIISHEEKQIIAGFEVPQDHVLVNEDGFLAEPGIIEHFAQSIALHQGYDYAQRNLPAPVGYIGSIKNFDIHQLPQAGQQLITTIHILQKMMGVTMVKGEVFADGVCIATGEMRTVIVDEIERG